MKKIYACLVGNWVCLDDDPEATVGRLGQSPFVWYEEGAELWSPLQREKADTYYQLDHVQIFYNGVSYRIHPSFIQIVGE